MDELHRAQRPTSPGPVRDELTELEEVEARYLRSRGWYALNPSLWTTAELERMGKSHTQRVAAYKQRAAEGRG